MRVFYAVITFCMISLFGCNKDNPVNPGAETVLFTSSFESNGNASYDGWSIAAGDSLNVLFQTDIPPGGGIYSISLQSVNTLPVQITRTVPAPVGNNVYTLSLYAKYFDVGGSFSFGIKGQQARKITDVTDSTWTQYKVTDTLTTIQGDSIIVTLSGGTDELLPGKTYYDLVTLKKD